MSGRRYARAEFVVVLALSMSLSALGIDILLPALGSIRHDLGLAEDSTAAAGLVTAYLLGLAIGQLGFGPILERFGRKPGLYVGFVVYVAGVAMASVAPSFILLLAGRFVWGVGAAGPRVATIAMVRDRFEGDRMARTMSLVMAVFIVVPMLAPSVGAVIDRATSWRVVVAVCALPTLALMIWARRLPETRPPGTQRSGGWGRGTLAAARTIVSSRQAVAHTLAMTALYGAFLSYLASSELIFTQILRREQVFPVAFGALAALMGLSMLVNSRVVGRLGVRRLTAGALRLYLLLSVVSLTVVSLQHGTPSLAVFLLCVAPLLAIHAVLIPNLHTLAMEPLGEVAGMASGLIGACQLALGGVVGAVIDRAYDGSALPLFAGFTACGLVAMASTHLARARPSVATP